MNDKYYTASEAQAKLGLSRSVFFRKVSLGLIPKIVQPGMKRGLYPKRDIDALAYSIHLQSEQDNKIVFGQSTPADQVEEMNISVRCFGRNFTTSLPERITFQQKAEYSFHSLKIDGHVVGYISLFRFSDAFLNQLLTGTKIESDITLKEVMRFTRFEPFDAFIGVIAIDPDLPAHLHSLWAGILIVRFIDFLNGLKTNGYEIKHVYGVTSTERGERLMSKLGFQRLAGKSLVKSRIPYCYNLDKPQTYALEKISNRGRIYG
jgi:predicted DNA-binding transcriptional regulator AlpA